MIFSSVFFIFVFLPVTLVLYYIVPWRLKNAVLLMFSLIFYAWGEPVYVFLMLFSIVFNYFSGIQINLQKESGQAKNRQADFIITVVVNIGVLGVFKYYGFLIGSLNAVLPFNIPFKELSLPIGISFYTFQALSYIIDVYRDKVPVQKNFIDFGVYVTMFPQLIAGPIVRYADIAKQLTKRKLSLYKFGNGLTWFIRGLAKKVLLANRIGVACDAILLIVPEERSVLTAWIGCLAYAMQIYFDFGGYSDMAVGLGKMLGFDFVKNFNYPYISESITEFWRRWHISLGTWFREYIYIPLGGNRVSVVKHIRNIMIVWGLTGLWHGAAWNFVLWGVYYGLLLVIEKYFLSDVLKRIPPFLCKIYSFLLVLFGWVLFFSSSLPDAMVYLQNMFGIVGNGIVDATGLYYLQSYLLLFIICIFCCSPWLWKKFRKFSRQKSYVNCVAAVAVYVILFILSVACMVEASYNPFLYFRF